MLNATRPNKKAAYNMLQAAADLGHIRAQAKLGWAYLLGSPFEQNITKAVEIFQELANKGDPDSQLVCFKLNLLLIFTNKNLIFRRVWASFLQRDLA
jgi:TPR repeat protein